MADLRKPVFVANSAAILGCTKIAEYLFQYDEAEAAPIQITNGLGVMPPEDSIGKYQIWTDTFTLGMTSLEEASPIFYSADSNSDEDILVGVNTIAGRLGLSLQTNVTVGKTWLEGLGEVYVHVNNQVGPILDAYHLNPSDAGGSVTWTGGLVLGMGGGSGSTNGPTAWDTVGELRFARYDAFGIDRLGDFSTASKIRIEDDVNNWVEYDVTFAYSTASVFTNGNHEMMLFNATSGPYGAGSRAINVDYSVDPLWVNIIIS